MSCCCPRAQVPHVHIHCLPRKAGDFERNDDVYDALTEAEAHLPRCAAFREGGCCGGGEQGAGSRWQPVDSDRRDSAATAAAAG